MAERQHLDQSEVNQVWSEVWKNTHVEARKVFLNRLFLEAYRVFRPLIGNATTILEIGTGSGRYAVAFARDLPRSVVTATDIVPASIEIAQRLAEEVDVKNIRFEIADAEALPYADDTFTVVFSDAVIQHVPDQARAVAEMVRVVQPGGLVVLAVVNGKSVHALIRNLQSLLGIKNEYGSEKFYSHADLRQLMRDAGLRVEVETGFYPAYGIYRLKRHAAIFGVLGRGMNRVTRFLDAMSRGFVSKMFGFEIVAVGRKSDGESS